MDKIDFKKLYPDLYSPPTGRFVEVDVPTLQFVMVDGSGDPNKVPGYKQAIEWLFSVSYAMKFAAKASLQKDYVVPPLEGLWWADDPEDFIARRKDRWCWTMMIMAPDFLNESMFNTAVEKAMKRLGPPPASLRLSSYPEGFSLQTLHIGSYDDEAPTLATLHNKVMPSLGLTFAGKHHEIYLSDARKIEPGRLRTILRQPAKKG